jgi:ABC-2 type transport system permease protein
MRALWTVFRREWLAYHQTPLALVFTVVFLAMSNSFVFYLGDLYETGQASMQAYFRLLPWVCLLLIPALSMRTWSEEFRSGTYELMETLPIPYWKWIAGKFMALWAVACGALVLSFPLWITLTWLGQPDHGVIALSYVGAFLMMGAMIAMGMCFSALSENQLVVYILSALCILLYLLSGYPLALNPVRELFSQSFVDVVSSISLLSHIQAVTRGVLELRDLLYFLLTIGFWLVLNLFALQKRRTVR